MSRIAIYSFVSDICSLSLSTSFSTSSALDVSTKTSTQALIIQKAKLLSVGFLETSSKSSAFTIHDIKSATSSKISIFLFFA
ncbi:hypothetical protein ACFLY2_00355 [Patescibacteria group bacterium]